VKVEKQAQLGLIVKNAGMDVFGQAFNIMLSFAASVIITRTIGADLFGKYSLANSLIQVLCIIAVFGLNRGVVRLTSRYMALKDTGRVKGTVVSGMVMSGAFSLVLVAVLMVAAPALTRRFYPHIEDLDLVMRVYVISLPFFVFMTVLVGYTQGLKTLKPTVVVEAFVRPVVRLATILLLFLVGLRFFAVVLGSVAGFVASAVVAFAFAVRISPFDFRRTHWVGVARELFFYSLPLVLANFMNVLISRSNVMISGYYLDTETVGILSAALVLAPFVSISLLSFSKILAPIISELWEKGDRLGLMTQFKTVSKWVFTISLPVMCMYFLFAPGLLAIFGEAFPRGATALRILAIGQIVNAVVGPIGFILTMTGRQKFDLINSICLAGSSVTLSILLAPRYGMNGVALATGMSLLAINVVRVIEVKILYGFTPFRYDMAKPLAAGAAASALLYILSRHLAWTGIPQTIGLCIAFLIVYLVVLYVLGLREELEVLKEILKRKRQ
jgi:O-antigen/teichoic acid export membrane protein